MANSRLQNSRIVGIVSAVPKNIVGNDYFKYLFSEEEINKIEKMTGIIHRRHADNDTCTSDLCEVAARRLLDKLEWSPESVDAIIFISQTPDYKLPATSCILQHKLGLSDQCAAFDVNLGCSGYVYGLWLASTLIVSHSAKRILLLVGDVSTKVISPNDRSTRFLFGDAGTATGIEYSDDSPPSSFVLGTDGSGEKNLIIPAGGSRNQLYIEGKSKGTLENGVIRGDHDLYMDGTEIFNFTLERVPNLISDLFRYSKSESHEVGFFVFHQANEFIIKHLAKKMKVDLTRVPISIKQFGNTSSASIPLTICTELSDADLRQSNKAVLVGFGVGYSWAASEVDLTGLRCNDWIEV